MFGIGVMFDCLHAMGHFFVAWKRSYATSRALEILIFLDLKNGVFFAIVALVFRATLTLNMVATKRLGRTCMANYFMHGDYFCEVLHEVSVAVARI